VAPHDTKTYVFIDQIGARCTTQIFNKTNRISGGRHVAAGLQPGKTSIGHQITTTRSPVAALSVRAGFKLKFGHHQKRQA
jgi:hypothetical protein